MIQEDARESDLKRWHLPKIIGLLSALSVAVGLHGCRAGGEDAVTAETGSSNDALAGTVRSITGSQNEMASWVVVFIERDTGLAHVDDIGALGNYGFSDLTVQTPHTVVLLDPQYRFSSVLSYPGDIEGTIYQYFTLSGDRMPSLVHNGPILSFTDTSSILWEDNIASDTDGDLIPDGQELSLELILADTDVDGLANEIDSDIDGDGVANWFDSDDDGDNVLDVFDTDSNGDGVADIAQSVGDIYFSSGLSYVMVQATQDVQADDSVQTSLLFTAKVADDYRGDAISIRGPSVLFDGAQVVTIDPNTGESSLTSWDQTLVDDGKNEDGADADGIFARKIQLAASVAPKAKQTVFFRIQYGVGESLRYDEFPFCFPNLTTGVIAGSFDVGTSTVTKSGQPFGSYEGYTWSIHIFDANGIKVFASEPVAGTTNTYVLPSGVLDTGQSYTAKVVAASLARVTSYPSWIIRSRAFDLQ